MFGVAEEIDGRYAIQRRLGAGGMAEVYLAHDDALHREVALKALNPALAADPAFVERFKREARAAAALTFPHIVTIYNWGESNGTYYIVMEYVPGLNLKEIIRARGPLPEADALDIAAQVASALAVAHQHGLVHRDIKPHNILIAPDGQAKVTDFGIAHAIGATQLTATNTVMGTAQYLSPEQALHQPVDGRSDLYSLGVVLSEMLTGTPPFDGDTPVAVALRHVHEIPPAPRAIRPDLSTATDEIVRRALAKEPAQRYQSASEMEAALMAARSRLNIATETTQPLAPVSVTEALPQPHARPGDRRTRFVPPPTDREVISPPAPLPARSRAAWGWFAAIPLLLLLIVGVGAFALRQGSRISATATPLTGTAIAASGQPTISPSPAIATATAIPSPTRPTNTVAPAASPAAPTVAPMIATVAPLAPAATATPLPTPRPMPLPSPSPMPPPTALPPTATAPPPTTAAQRAPEAGTPASAVEAFYQRVSAHDFDGAVMLWSDGLKRACPPAECINGRFATTTKIVIASRGTLTEQGNTATLPVALLEYKQGATMPSPINGTWQLVRGANGWLLSQFTT